MKTCRICGGTKFKKVIDFGRNPLVNSLIDKEDLDLTEPTYPLVVEQCQDCFLVQITKPIDSHKIYRDQDYLYYSGDMPGLNEYFHKFALDLKDNFLSGGELVVEIGSNDGIFLKHFPDQKVLGVDPSTNVVVRALKDGITTISDGFTERLANTIKREFGKATIIGGSNCIAHIDNIRDLIRGVKTLLTEDGVFFVECNYWGGMVKNKNYALIYHDHFSYFTLKNWIDFLKGFNMEVFHAEVTPAQGGSLRIYCCNTGQHPKSLEFDKLLQEEIDNNLNSYKTAQQYAKDVKYEAAKLGKLVKDLKAQGKTIAGYGAAAKGFSVLKLAEITDKEIDYFIDDSPAKQGKYTPVTHIPVISRKEVVEDPNYLFITAPNYEEVIVAKEREFLENGGHFITCDSRII